MRAVGAVGSRGPRVSVIVPFFNAQAFMAEAVDSVRAQSFTDWELILVDDGSSDASTELADRYARECPGKIQRFEHRGRANRGISASLNLGIRESRGEFVALLDADDVWFPSKLEEQVALLAAHPEAAMVYGRSQYWYSWTGRIEDRPRDLLEPLGVAPEQIVDPPDLLLGMLDGSIPAPPPCSVLLRRDAVERVGGFEASVANSHSDQSLYTKLFLENAVFASAKCWARYRQHPHSALAKSKRTGARDGDRRRLLEWFSGYVERNGRGDDRVRTVLGEQLSEVRYRTDSRLGRFLRDPRRAVGSVLKRSVPAGALDVVRRIRDVAGGEPGPGRVRWGDLRRLEPISRRWGFDRGLPIDRYYVEALIGRCASDVRGRVMEMGDDSLTWRFGKDAVTRSDVLNLEEGDPKTTLVADLTDGAGLPSDRFDCIIFTQTLHYLYDVREGLRTLHRMLAPGGVLLATFPGITRIGRPDWGTAWYWSFTEISARRLFEEAFPGGDVAVESWGNVLSATAFLWGLAAGELEEKELKFVDPEYPVIIGVRAVKAVAQ